MSHQSDTLHKSCVQRSGQGLRSQSPQPQLMELVLRLQQTIEVYITQLETGHLQQGPGLEKQRHSQDTREQEVLLVYLMSQLVNVLQSKATSSLELQLPRLCLDSRHDIGGERQGPPSRQPNQPSYQRSDLEAAFVSYDLSNRGIDISALYRSSFQDYVTYQGDQYHEDKNILGFINLGVSENKLCTDLMTERLSRRDMNYIDEALLQYSDWRGQAFLREEVARFLTYYCKAPTQLDPENVIVLNSCLSVFLALSMVLCDPGEALLTPTPFHAGFSFTSHLYAKVELIHVHLDREITEVNAQPFQLTVDKLEEALHEARFKGKKIKGLVLINPHNPLGDIYSRDSLKEYLEFAKRYNLHVIIDEIYMLTVFDESVTFHSVLSIESLPDPSRTHVIWGTSKGFGLSGICFGALYSHNKEVVSAVHAFGVLHSLSGITQHKLCRLLRDREWIDKVYLPANRSRLQAAHRYITNKLKALKVPFLSCGSGLCVWISLKKYLDPCTFEEEQLLYHRFLRNKLILSPGKSYMCKEPGWFRLTFANKPFHLKVAMHRFSQALADQKQEWIEKQLADAMREDAVCLPLGSSGQSSASGPKD
ncbi:probable inactive 1-aminocyclopropane-1-carboxylate synthase-like protein 2 [Saccopteryx leptura]|uniref:probable inactive 1-aminocyclopropane-1-carboxylate synthase-like protein 2 n=1 Tax=Saccopteryx leptura TaxID=249018 RepID=UPI00339C5CE5